MTVCSRDYQGSEKPARVAGPASGFAGAVQYVIYSTRTQTRIPAGNTVILKVPRRCVRRIAIQLLQERIPVQRGAQAQGFGKSTTQRGCQQRVQR